MVAASGCDVLEWVVGDAGPYTAFVYSREFVQNSTMGRRDAVPYTHASHPIKNPSAKRTP